MKKNADKYIRLGIGLAVAFIVWTVWVQAQTATTTQSTNRSVTVVETNTNTTAPKTATVEQSTTTTQRTATLLDQQVTFGLDRIGVLQIEFLGNPLWKYVATLLYILVALYFSKLLDYLFHAWLKKWTAKTKTKLDDLLVGLIHGPVKIICFVILLHIGMNLFTWPAWVSTYLSKGLKLVVAASLTYVAVRFVDLLMSYWRYRSATETDKTFNEQLYHVVSKSLKAFIVVVSILLTTQNLGLDITSVLASLSIGGLAVGLAAQDTLANLFGAVAVFLDKPFHIGDRIKLDGGVDGVVENIGLRSTRVRSLDGFLITVPNKTMGNATITNIARRPSLKTEINIGLTYDTTTEQLKRALELLREIFGRHPMTKEVSVNFNKFGDSALNIQIVHWWKNTDYNAYLAGMEELHISIKQQFEAEKLNFAFPSQTIYMKQDSEWRLTQWPSPASKSDGGNRLNTPTAVNG